MNDIFIETVERHNANESIIFIQVIHLERVTKNT